jgi:hypothetical protein
MSADTCLACGTGMAVNGVASMPNECCVVYFLGRWHTISGACFASGAGHQNQ